MNRSDAAAAKMRFLCAWQLTRVQQAACKRDSQYFNLSQSSSPILTEAPRARLERDARQSDQNWRTSKHAIFIPLPPPPPEEHETLTTHSLCTPPRLDELRRPQVGAAEEIVVHDLRHHHPVVAGLPALLRQVTVGAQDAPHARPEERQHERVVD